MFHSARKKHETVIRQVKFCSLLMERINNNVVAREGLRSSLNTFPPLEQQLTKAAVQREITELRMGLLELSKMLEV